MIFFVNPSLVVREATVVARLDNVLRSLDVADAISAMVLTVLSSF